MTDHSLLGPSSAHRWLQCPGSLALSEGIPRETSKYAEEGSQAHEYAAQCLRDNMSAKEACNDPEMAKHVQVYLDFVRDVGAGGEIEYRIESQSIPDFGGTIDYCYVSEGTLHVVDLKYGVGIRVAAERNPQLLSYLLLAWERHRDARYFFASICQPRLDHCETVEFTTEDLTKFRDKVKAAATQSHFSAGDHCRFCPAIHICNTIADHTIAVAREDFGPAINDDVLTRWAEILRLGPAIKALLSAIPARVLEELRRGRSIEGFKVVRSLTNTTWIDDETTTLRKLRNRKIGKRLATVAKLKSPTQLKKEGYGDQIADLSHRAERGLTVVPTTDRRQAVEFAPAGEQFDDLSFLGG